MVAGAADRRWCLDLDQRRASQKFDFKLAARRPEMNQDTPTKRDRGPVIGDVVFIVVGLVLLLEKTGYLPPSFGLHFWPCIFVVIGIVKIVYAGGRPTGAALIAVGIFLQLHEMGFIHMNFWDL